MDRLCFHTIWRDGDAGASAADCMHQAGRSGAGLGVDLTACQQLEGYYLEDQIQSLGIGSIAVDEESNTVNLEQVLSYEPDLILLRDSFEPSVYEELSKIAPVAAFDLKDTEVSLLAMGKALGMEQEALSRLEQYHQKLDNAKEALSAVSDNETAMLRVLKRKSAFIRPLRTI